MYDSERDALTALLRDRCPEPVCIVDLGAHDGATLEWMLGVIAGKHSRAIAVEADRTSFDVLAARGLDASLVHCAIAGHTGTCDFWENPLSGGGYGSIYKPLDGLSVDYSGFRKVGPISCFTLDELIQTAIYPDPIDLLVADIHGAERDMIAHGQMTLTRTRFLFMEVFESAIYQGMAARSELLAMLPGWKVLESFPWNVLLENQNYESAA